MRKLREEVDEVLGYQEIQLGDLNKLPYLIGESIIHPFLLFNTDFTLILWLP